MQPERFKNLKTVIHLLENIQGFDEFFNITFQKMKLIA